MEKRELIQAQLGGEAQQSQTKQGGSVMAQLYYPDDREIWWNSRLGDVVLRTYDEGWRGKLHGEMKLIAKIYEKCDCYEKYGDIKHHNGGNYHRIIRVYQITPHIYVATFENTREVFSMDEVFDVVIFWKGEAFDKLVLKDGEWAMLLKKEEVERMLKRYQDDDEYDVYYEDEK